MEITAQEATSVAWSDFPPLDTDPTAGASSPAFGNSGQSGSHDSGASAEGSPRPSPLRGAHGGGLPAHPGAAATTPDKARGEARSTFGTETWVAGPQAFLFRCQDARRGDRWTFCVSRATLEELEPRTPFKPAAAFEALRARIHSAASARMKVADPNVQQVLSAYDIRYARTGARRNEAKKQR